MPKKTKKSPAKKNSSVVPDHTDISEPEATTDKAQVSEPQESHAGLNVGTSTEPQEGHKHDARSTDANTQGQATADDNKPPSAFDLDPQALGKRGEEAAAAFLRRHGYAILERNWWSRIGEVDIIAAEEETNAIVFIEVKTRSSLEKGFPEEAVTPEKRRKYETMAALWFAENEFADIPIRFDVISLLVIDDHRAYVRHHVNAFGGDL